MKNKHKNKVGDKKHIKQLEQEINDTYEQLKLKTQENERLGQEVKQLKRMLPKKIKESPLVENSKDEQEGENDERLEHNEADLSGDLKEVEVSDEEDQEQENNIMKDMDAGMDDPALDQHMEL